MFRWANRNWADTDEGIDPKLVPLELPLPIEKALERIQLVISQMSRWRVVAVDPQASQIKATRQTRIFRFIDDITVRLEATTGGTRVHFRSQSRVGKGDLGQNRRNILELVRALRQ